jgi:hypothetical protein
MSRAACEHSGTVLARTDNDNRGPLGPRRERLILRSANWTGTINVGFWCPIAYCQCRQG